MLLLLFYFVAEGAVGYLGLNGFHDLVCVGKLGEHVLYPCGDSDDKVFVPLLVRVNRADHLVREVCFDGAGFCDCVGVDVVLEQVDRPREHGGLVQGRVAGDLADVAVDGQEDGLVLRHVGEELTDLVARLRHLCEPLKLEVYGHLAAHLAVLEDGAPALEWEGLLGLTAAHQL